MNNNFKKINEEKVLFFDIEDVRRSKELDINSREYELYEKKTRNRETDEYLPSEEVIEDYAKRAALKMCYTKIVTIGVGFIKNGEVHIKSLVGEEKDIIEQFCTIAQSFDYVCGANIIHFDIPMIINNGWRYMDVSELLPDRFITSGKRPWELKNVIDLMDVFKGTHYYNSTVDEICYHFGIKSPKTELDGSMVSEEYYTNGVEKVAKYVKEDVLANVNIFRKMRFQDVFETFIDKSDVAVEEKPILEKIYKAVKIDKKTKVELTKLLSAKKLLKKDRKIIEDILVSLYVNNTMFESDSKKIKEAKIDEIKKLISSI